MSTPMKLKAKYGYWDTTHYGIGGCFRRCGREGKVITAITGVISPSYKGCNVEVEFGDGTTGAMDRAHIIPATL